ATHEQPGGDLPMLMLAPTTNSVAFDTTQVTRGGVRAARLRAIKSDVAANLGRRDLSLHSVAKRHGISPNYLRKLMRCDGTNFTKYVLGERLARAFTLLSDMTRAAQSISSIAYDSGFGDLSYFNHAFRRRYGTTPSSVRTGALRQVLSS